MAIDAKKPKRRNWPALIEAAPEFALECLAQPDTRDECLVALQDREVRARFINQVEEQDWLVNEVSEWGTYFEFPDELGPALRRAARVSAERCAERAAYYRRPATFRFNLPEDAALLPHAVNAAVEGALSQALFGFDDEDRTLSARKRLAKYLGEYVAEPGELYQLFESDVVTQRVRAAAVTAFYLHPENATLILNISALEVLVDTYDASYSSWYLPAVGVLLTDAVGACSHSACDAIGKLLERAGSDYPGRLDLSEVLRGWREFARAPVQHRSTPQLWR